MRHRKEDNSISGFLTYDTNFFDCTFLSLIIVSPTKEGGLCKLVTLIYVKSFSYSKIFSSTNESNESMQKVFNANGFIRSGIVENLDEGDPEIIFYTKSSEHKRSELFFHTLVCNNVNKFSRNYNYFTNCFPFNLVLNCFKCKLFHFFF